MSMKQDINVGDIIIVKNLVFKVQNKKISPQIDHAINGRPCIVVAKHDGILYVIAVKGEYGYEKNDLKFMPAHNESFTKKSLYQIQEIHQIHDCPYPYLGKLDKRELYELLYSLSWYQFASQEFYQHRYFDDTMLDIYKDINSAVLNLNNDSETHKSYH